MLMVLHNNAVMAKKVTRKYETQFAKTGAKIGASCLIRKPPRFQVTTGRTFVPQDYADESVNLQITEEDQIGVAFSTDDLTLSMDDFDGRVLKPSLVPMANKVDKFIASSYADVWNATGTPGTVAATDTPFLDARDVKLFNNAALLDNISMFVTGRVSGRLSSGLAGRFNPQREISDLYLKGMMAGGMKGMVGHALGWDFFEDQNMPTHTTGAWAGATPVVSAANQTGASITTSGWTASVTGLGKKGDIVQFAGVFQVNPVTYDSTGELQDFTLTADVDSDGSGLATLPISPPITIAGKSQTVNASPANSAAITVWGTGTVANVASKTSPQCLGWPMEAIALAFVDLMLPEEGTGVKATRVADEDLGLAFLYMRGYDIANFSMISRIDSFYGKSYLRPEHIVRVAS